MAPYDSDTIAAVSTPPGEAAVGIVRLSGPDALTIASRLFVSPKGKTLRPHRMSYGYIHDPATGERVDEALVSYMPAPRSYTREDVVEINCHGGIAPLRRVLELALKEGARLAGPGEFTKRAFLNGRIDLSQAEAVMDLIRAKTEAAERLAMRQLEGGLSEKVKALADRLTDICAHVEAYIDFPEEEIEPRPLGEMREGIGQAALEAEGLSRSFAEGRFFREGLKVAIVGRPNVGKSSLLNALLESDRAIVTEMPGTTRDVIEERLDINGLPVCIMDTAGIREAHDMAEAEGVRRSLRALEGADLVLAVLDGSAPMDDEDAVVVGRMREKNAIAVVNKADLPQAIGDVSGLGLKAVAVSAKSGHGLEALKGAIYASCLGSPAAAGEGVVVTNLRHRLALDRAASALRSALGSMGKAPVEISAMELREALDALGEITGRVTSDDILERIFSEFCVGK